MQGTRFDKAVEIFRQSGDYMECTIDCQGSARAEHRGFRFETAVGTGDVTLEDIAIINGYVTEGGGVYIQANGEIQFWYCDIVSNEAPRAGGVRMAGGTPFLQHCNVSRNDATAGHSGGIWLQGGFVNFCTIVENSATSGGGGVYCAAGTGGMNECIIAFTEDGVGVGATEGNAPSLSCCDVFGNVEGDYDAEVGDLTGFDLNFSLDPELCGIELADYQLFDTSPCLAANSPCDSRVGRYGQGCDTPVEGMSWGRVKTLYR